MSTQPDTEIDTPPPSYQAPRHDIPKGGRSGFALVEGRQVHYLEWGHRGLPPVLCLHGGGQTAYMYEDLGRALAGRAHLLAPDLPSHGDSDPSGVGPLTPEMPVHRGIAETMPALLEHFGMDRVVLVGASLGGMAGITLAALRPDLVEAIALIDVGHKLEPEGVRKIVDFMTAHESFGSLEEAADAIAEYLPQRRAPRIESLTRNLRQRPDGRWEWKHAVGRRMREAMANDEEVKHPADNLHLVMAGVEDAARQLTCPVLVLRGEKSDVLSDEGAEDLVRIVPNARVALVADAGHLAAGDNPHTTVEIITEFLAELSWLG